METRLANALKRIGEADAALRDGGRDPEPFLLVYSFGPNRGIKHPTWDDSWACPTAEDIDDLAELGYLRGEQSDTIKRIFSLTVKGRAQATALVTSVGTITHGDGRPPPLDKVLDWLVEVNATTPEALRLPTQLLDAAVRASFIATAAREPLARQLIQLVADGYLAGELPDLQQVSAEHRLGLSSGLELTMKAHDRVAASATGPAMNFYGSVVAGQIAAGSIANYVTFSQLLDKAAEELDRLTEVDEVARSEARSLLDLLRGRTVDVAGLVASGAGGHLLGTVLAQLLGLSP